MDEESYTIYNDKVILVYILLTSALCIATALINGGIILSLAYICMTSSIVVYSDRVVLGMWLMFLSEILNMLNMIPAKGIQINFSTIVLFIGTIVTLIAIIIDIRRGNIDTRNTLVSKIKAVVNYKARPKKLSMSVRLILYSIVILSIIVITRENIAKDGTINHRLQLLHSMWVIIPSITAILFIFRYRDVYMFTGICQIIHFSMIYVGYSLGEVEYIHTIYLSLMITSTLLGYILLKADDFQICADKYYREQSEYDKNSKQGESN